MPSGTGSLHYCFDGMSRHLDPRSVVERIGLGAVGLLVAIGAGTGAASYAISGVDPFYFSGGGLRSPRPSFDGTSAPNDAPSSSTTFPSVPGDHYYYYRAPPVTASYDARPRYETTISEPLRDGPRASEPNDRDVPSVESDTSPEGGDIEPAVDVIEGSADGEKYAPEGVPPDPNN